MSVVAIKDIRKGGEVFSSYNYDERSYKVAGIKYTEVQCEKVSALHIKEILRIKFYSGNVFPSNKQ